MPPNCDCHGLPKVWVPREAMKTGGFWRCNAKQHRQRLRKEKQRERSRQYRLKNREAVCRKQRENAEIVAVRSGHIPIGPVRRVVEEFARSVAWDHQPHSLGAGGEPTVKPLAPLERLRCWVGVESDLYFLRKANKKWVNFDLADKIITAINPHLWHTDPELSEIYQAANLTALDEKDYA